MIVETEVGEGDSREVHFFFTLACSFKRVGNSGRDERCEAAQLKRMLSQPR
jgi:hypothetical protein